MPDDLKHIFCPPTWKELAGIIRDIRVFYE
jgi:hypothetical protein